MQDIYDYIEAHQAEAVADLRRFCAQPSVSTEARGMAEMAALVGERLAASGFVVETIPLAGGFPLLYAESRDDLPEDAPTLLIYNHYDVQPEGDLALWDSPPFTLTERDGMLVGRGVADNKGNIIARLAALDAVRAVRGGLPVRVKWVIEGEEEIGSPHLDTFLLAHHERLAATGCIWEFGSYTWDGTPQVMLGLKGMVDVVLRAHGANRDLHSSMAAFVTSPVWRLVLALASIKDENEGILIGGFYDQMRGPSDTQITMVQALPDDDTALLESLDLPEFALGLRGFRRHMAEVFSPTCNIQGIISGYTGPGSKTVLPNVAEARLDLRLVPDQNPHEIVDLLRDHLKESGFADIEVAMEPGAVFPARSDPDHPFVQLVLAAVAEAAGRAPAVWPSSPASGPMYSFTNGLGLPVVAIGVGNPASAAHGPNENIRLTDFLAGTQQIAQVLVRLGEQRAADLRQAPALVPTEPDVEPVFDTDGLFTMPPAELFDTAMAERDATVILIETSADPVAYEDMVFETDALFEMPSDLDMLTLGDPPPAAPPPAEVPAAATPRKRRTRTRKSKEAAVETGAPESERVAYGELVFETDVLFEMPSDLDMLTLGDPPAAPPPAAEAPAAPPRKRRTRTRKSKETTVATSEAESERVDYGDRVYETDALFEMPSDLDMLTLGDPPPAAQPPAAEAPAAPPRKRRTRTRKSKAEV